MFSQIAVLVVLILLNAYFAASEIAFISLNDAKIEKQAKEGNKKAKQIYKMLKNPSKFLATIQIGITLAGFLSSAFASDAFADKLAPMLNNLLPMLGTDTWRTISIILITILLSFFTLVFGELVPKRLAMKYYEKVSFGTIGVIRGISFITAPFVKLLTFSTNVISKIFGVKENEEEIVTEEEIKMMIDEGEEKGTIDQEEKELLNNVFEFNDTTASEIMTPRIDIFALKISQDLYEVLDELDDYKYSRIPVYEDTIDNINNTLSLLLGGIASISLIVGGIGVMNVMLVSVTERTKEIGIRKALGAKRIDILMQFFIEALVLCILGGLVGIAVGLAGGTILGKMGYTFIPSIGIVSVAFLSSVLIGTIFGIFPANKASKLNPIDALHTQ